jgi:hypothetical protein
MTKDHEQPQSTLSASSIPHRVYSICPGLHEQRDKSSLYPRQAAEKRRFHDLTRNPRLVLRVVPEHLNRPPHFRGAVVHTLASTPIAHSRHTESSKQPPKPNPSIYSRPPISIRRHTVTHHHAQSMPKPPSRNKYSAYTAHFSQPAQPDRRYPPRIKSESKQKRTGESTWPYCQAQEPK